MIQPQPSQLRKYFYEYTTIALVGAIVFLTLQILDLNKFIRNNLYEQRIEVIKALERTSNALDQNTRALNRLQMKQGIDLNNSNDK